jgi:hypothetical protein
VILAKAVELGEHAFQARPDVDYLRPASPTNGKSLLSKLRRRVVIGSGGT